MRHWGRVGGFSALNECFAAFKFAVIMASIGTNRMRAGLMPPESAFDISNTATPLFDRLFAERGLVF